ncbi:hypothetical protein GCM10027167_15490 [Nocardia heshunensis]
MGLGEVAAPPGDDAPNELETAAPDDEIVVPVSGGAMPRAEAVAGLPGGDEDVPPSGDVGAMKHLRERVG